MNAVPLLAAEKFWILDPLYALLGQLLAWFYALVPSYGVAIALLTMAVSVLRMPLVAKQVKSQQEMQKIGPELKRVQAKYKADPQKRNEEMMRLYKEHNVNPFAGCLPLLLQMPLFIVLYRLILQLNTQPEPKHVPRGSELFDALVAAGGSMQSFGMDLSRRAADISGFTNLLPYLVLIALVLATGFYQQKQMTARMPKDGANAQILMMTKVIPIFLAVVSWTIPAGVVVYFFISNLWQIGQQGYLFRRQQLREAAEPPKGKGGGTAVSTPKPKAPASGGASSNGTSARGGKGRSSATGAGAGAGGTKDRADVAPDVDPGAGDEDVDDDGPVDDGGDTRPAPRVNAGADEAATAGAPAPGGFMARLAKALGTPNPNKGLGGGTAGVARPPRQKAPRARTESSGNGKTAGKGGSGAGGKSSGGNRPAGRSGSNGRVTPRGSSGRAQGKGGSSSRSKPRNTRRGK